MNELIAVDSSLALGDDLAGALAEFLRLNVASGDASPKYIASIQTEIGQFLAWCKIAGVSPLRATERDLRAYRSHLITKHTRGTIATKLAALRRLYEAAVWRGLRPDNPAKGLKAPKDKTSREDAVKFLPLEGFKRLLAMPDNTRDRAILALLGYHGLRVDEVARLELGSIKADHLIVTGKGNKKRKVYLIEASAGALADWLDHRPGGAAAQTVFVSMGNRSKGRPLTTRGIRFMVDGYLTRAGLKAAGISCHSLRHSFATWSLAGGAKLQAISGALGHSSIETTQVYAKLVDRLTDNPARYLAALLGE